MNNQIRQTARYKSCTMLDRHHNGIMGSNSTRSVDVWGVLFWEASARPKINTRSSSERRYHAPYISNFKMRSNILTFKPSCIFITDVFFVLLKLDFRLNRNLTWSMWVINKWDYSTHKPMKVCSVKRSKGYYLRSRRRLAASDSGVSCRVATLEYFQTSVHQETQHTDLEYIQE